MLDRLIQFWKSLPSEAQLDIIKGATLLVIGAITTLILQRLIWPLVKAIGTGLLEWVYPHLAAWAFNWWAARRYRASLRKNIGRLSNPWIPTPLQQLAEIYIPVQVQDVSAVSKHAQTTPAQEKDIRVFPVEEIFSRFNRLVVVGGPGSGKSTITQALALDCLEGRLSFHAEREPLLQRLARNPWQPPQVLPVVLELKEFGRSDKMPLDYIVEEFEKHDFPNARSFVERKLRRGEILLLFDGLDEVAEAHRLMVIQQLCEFLSRERYALNAAVVTCRAAVYNGELDQVVDVTASVVEFTTKQIYRFLLKWSPYYPEGKGSKNLMGILMGIDVDEASYDKGKRTGRLLQLARNPLMLTIITYFYINDIPLPESRVGFYTECTDALLEKWHKFKVVMVNKYSAWAKRRVLQRLALFSHYNLREECSKDEAVRHTRDVLPQVGLKPELAEDVLNEIIQNTGLMVLTGVGHYRYPHLMFQEYFAANEVSRLGMWDSLLKWLSENPNQWREVVLLYCGMSDLRSRNLAIAKLLKMGKTELAALAVADSEEIDIRLAKSVLAALKQKCVQYGPEDQLLEALALLSSNQGLICSDDAFEFLEGLLRSQEMETKWKVLRVLANVSTARSAEILVRALAVEDTRAVALRALSTLGEAAIGPLEQGLMSWNLKVVKACIRAWLGMGSRHFTSVVVAKLTSEVALDTRIAVAVSLSETLTEWAFGEGRELLIHKEEIEQLQGEGFLGPWIWPSHVPPSKEIRLLFSTIIDALAEGIQDDSKYHRWNDDIRSLPYFVLIPVAIEIRDKNERDKRVSSTNFLEALPFREMIESYSVASLRRSWGELLDRLEVREESTKLNIRLSTIGIAMFYSLFGIPALLAILSQAYVPVSIGKVLFDAGNLILFSTFLLYIVSGFVFAFNRHNRTSGTSRLGESIFITLSPFLFMLTIFLSPIWAIANLLIAILVVLPVFVLINLLLPIFSPLVTVIIVGVFALLAHIAELLAGTETEIVELPPIHTLFDRRQNPWIGWLTHHPKELKEIKELQRLMTISTQ